MNIRKIEAQIEVYFNNIERITNDTIMNPQQKSNFISFFDGAIYELKKVISGKYDYTL